MNHIKILLFFVLIFTSSTVFAADKTVTLSTLEWAPYIGQELNGKGYVYELVAEAFKRSGYKAEIRFYPWVRAVKLVELGQRDGVFPEYYGKESLKTSVFSDPFPGGPVGFYKRKDLNVKYSGDPQQEQLNVLFALRKYRFGVVRGYLNTEVFDAADFLKKDIAKTDEFNLKKLEAKRIHFIFIDKFVAQYLIKTKFPDFEKKLEFMEPPLENKPLYIGFSKQAADYKQKLKAFNQGLKIIKTDGTLKKIMKKHGF